MLKASEMTFAKQMTCTLSLNVSLLENVKVGIESTIGPGGIIVVVWIKSYVFKTSSGFSVDCCINEEKVICYNLRLENNFRPNAPVVISMKVKKCETNIAIYSYALLRICVNGGQMSVRIAPPSLPPHQVVQQPGTSSPPSQLKYSSEGVI